MPLFSAKVDYALRAAVDLALQSPNQACQSREIAARQGIRGPYLDQILNILKREGIVRSIRGAGGGYAIGRDPRLILVGDVVRAIVGDQFLLGGASSPDPGGAGATYVVRQFEAEAERELARLLDSVSLADLAARKQELDDSMSIMAGL